MLSRTGVSRYIKKQNNDPQNPKIAEFFNFFTNTYYQYLISQRKKKPLTEFIKLTTLVTENRKKNNITKQWLNSLLSVIRGLMNFHWNLAALYLNF